MKPAVEHSATAADKAMPPNKPFQWTVKNTLFCYPLNSNVQRLLLGCGIPLT
ncbi:hypothetical protein QTH90_21035 [Variovorax sp. J2P1-59]|uniref:hypothetical protein n=1 Tax=Variovorax flavidus TaxID=3053501 RepID=UPI0025780AC8|nr:hypothetical protein [Variovorax sp. J2P1-59]MDM0076907.1 hypothetical protein [Variovorax sp. J2P1-59]